MAHSFVDCAVTRVVTCCRKAGARQQQKAGSKFGSLLIDDEEVQAEAVQEDVPAPAAAE